MTDEQRKQLARELRNAPREGADTDKPEGMRYIKISDTLAGLIADALEEIENNGLPNP